MTISPPPSLLRLSLVCTLVKLNRRTFGPSRSSSLMAARAASRQLLEDFGHPVSLEHSSDKWVTFAWPQRIAQQCEDTAALLQQSRDFFLEEVRQCAFTSCLGNTNRTEGSACYFGVFVFVLSWFHDGEDFRRSDFSMEEQPPPLPRREMAVLGFAGRHVKPSLIPA